MKQRTIFQVIRDTSYWLSLLLWSTENLSFWNSETISLIFNSRKVWLKEEKKKNTNCKFTKIACQMKSYYCIILFLLRNEKQVQEQQCSFLDLWQWEETRDSERVVGWVITLNLIVSVTANAVTQISTSYHPMWEYDFPDSNSSLSFLEICIC